MARYKMRYKVGDSVITQTSIHTMHTMPISKGTIGRVSQTAKSDGRTAYLVEFPGHGVRVAFPSQIKLYSRGR